MSTEYRDANEAERLAKAVVDSINEPCTAILAAEKNLGEALDKPRPPTPVFVSGPTHQQIWEAIAGSFLKLGYSKAWCSFLQHGIRGQSDKIDSLLIAIDSLPSRRRQNARSNNQQKRKA